MQCPHDLQVSILTEATFIILCKLFLLTLVCRSLIAQSHVFLEHPYKPLCISHIQVSVSLKCHVFCAVRLRSIPLIPTGLASFPCNVIISYLQILEVFLQFHVFCTVKSTSIYYLQNFELFSASVMILVQ